MKRVIITLRDNAHYEIRVQDSISYSLLDIDKDAKFILIDDFDGARHFINIDNLQAIVIREVSED